MKIIYFSHTFFSDCDFPLIRELENLGHEVISYYHLAPYETNAGLVEIKNQFNKDSILPASDFDEMQKYKDFVNLKRIYFVNNPHYRRYHIYRYTMWYDLYKHIKKQKGDILQLTYQLSGKEKILYNLKLPIVLTVHDPFLHSGRFKEQMELDRIETFKRAKKIILLNNCLKAKFLDYYNISEEKVVISSLGEYSHLNFIGADKKLFTEKKYIFFWGYIAKYKGIEYLLEAMVKVHEEHPDIDLILIGRGKMYFDYSKYEKLEYIKFINRFATVEELSTLLKNCLFVVCPYVDATQSGVIQTAFSADVPVIATNVGSFSKSIENGVTGIIVPPCNVNSLTDAICDLLQNEDKLLSLKENIKNNWHEKMSWKPIAYNYIEAYEDILWSR